MYSKFGRARRGRTITVVIALAGVVALRAAVAAQGINYPVGSPTGTSGAGNARTDPDNLFIRNNVAGMTEIALNSDEEQTGKLVGATGGRWRWMGDLQLGTYRYSRERIPPGPAAGLVSETRLGLPGLATEATYVSGSHRYALGFGLYTIYGFQSKLQDPAQLGPFATFFDTRVASNDLAAGGAVRLHPKLSVGGSFIIGRGFADLSLPNPQLAPLGIARQDRLDVSGIGAPGVSVGLHYRPTERISLGINYKTRRSYDLEGDLSTFVAAGGAIVPVNPQVAVKLKPPAAAEGGIEIKALNQLRLFADFRFYDYTAAFQEIAVNERQSGQTLSTLRLEMYDVRSVRAGGIYTLSEATKIHFGWAYTSNGIPAANLTPGTINLGGFDLSGGIGKRIGGHWLNLAVAGILGRSRTIGPLENPTFAGRYSGRGAMLGLGWRW
ncbi:MAG TPA: outer membrane protein transport protein [Blastocatellia bacterium]|nr:outer membrane protein transport protein [Blastocatellia bacterium]